MTIDPARAPKNATTAATRLLRVRGWPGSAAGLDKGRRAGRGRHQLCRVTQPSGLTEEQARRSLVPSRTTLLGLVKHATFVEKVWLDEAVTCRSRAEIGIPATPDESFILHDSDTIATTQRANRAACESSRRATSSLGLDDQIHGNRRGPAPVALGVSPGAARARSALRARRHPARAAHKRVARQVSAHGRSARVRLNAVRCAHRKHRAGLLRRQELLRTARKQLQQQPVRLVDDRSAGPVRGV